MSFLREVQLLNITAKYSFVKHLISALMISASVGSLKIEVFVDHGLPLRLIGLNGTQARFSLVNSKKRFLSQACPIEYLSDTHLFRKSAEYCNSIMYASPAVLMMPMLDRSSF